MSILSLGAIDVPLYPSLPPNQIEYLLQNSGAKAIVVSNMLQLGKILSIWQNLPDLMQIIILNRLEEKIDDVCDLNNCKLKGKKFFGRTHGCLKEPQWIPTTQQPLFTLPERQDFPKG